MATLGMNKVVMRSLLWIMIPVVTAMSFCGCRSKAATSIETGNDERMIVAVPDSAYAVSVFLNDAGDPINSAGIDFPVGDAKNPAVDPFITVSSSNTGVVPNTGLFVSGSGLTRNLKIDPVAAGYATITITVINGTYRRSYLLNYAVSQAQTMKGRSWHNGIADASAAIVIDDDHMLVANDETNLLYLYNRRLSGMPVRSFDYNEGNALGLTDSIAGKWKEVDVEAGVRSTQDPSIIYWIGSMSNNSSFLNKPNRNRLFAMRVSGKIAEIKLTNAGYSDQLRRHLVLWGNAHGYNFDSSAAAGRDCKRPDGFNIEGMVFGPDKRTMYIGFRAPLVPLAHRTKALIAPINNFEKWFNNGSPAGDPQIGAPIELDLGGRGIRDIICIPDGSYVIIAGSCGAELVPAVYTWTGNKNDAPVENNSFELSGLNVEGVVPVYEDGKLLLNKLQVVTDNGNQIFYGDTVLAKNLPVANFKKFSSVITESRKKDNLVPSGKQ
ncbi:MAG TPA: hypothetical protein VMZ03_02275 [Chitinophagaceae bacterium]|nr:hypothetical protein [Chitinophagaceae bacterium]